jgi:hypothetical protein
LEIVMNELLKGLIDAELTLLGMHSAPASSQAPNTFAASGAAQGKGKAVPGVAAPQREEAGTAVRFSDRDYRTAGG